MQKMGDSIDVSAESVKSASQFISALYYKGNVTDINELCYTLFLQPGKEKMLPPTKDSFQQHILQANYTAFIWKQSLEAATAIPTPEGHVWTIQNGKLAIVYMTNQPAPLQLRELIRCGCQTACTRATHSCRKEELSCTDSCQCAMDSVDCNNPYSSRDDSSTDSDDSIDDDEDNMM